MWHHCGKSNTLKLEKIQFRALKFVFNDNSSSYSDLLIKAKLPTLEVARLQNIAMEVFKAVNNLGPKYLSDLFNTKETPYDLRNKNVLTRCHSKTNKGLNSFSNFGVKVWNSLPNQMRVTTDYKTFKKLIKTWSGFKCHCRYCRQN